MNEEKKQPKIEGPFKLYEWLGSEEVFEVKYSNDKALCFSKESAQWLADALGHLNQINSAETTIDTPFGKMKVRGEFALAADIAKGISENVGQYMREAKEAKDKTIKAIRDIISVSGPLQEQDKACLEMKLGYILGILAAYEKHGNPNNPVHL